MSVNDPVNTSEASSLPSPVEKVRPVVSPSVSVPLLTDSVTCSALEAASTSAIAMPLIARLVSSFTLVSAGSVSVG